MKNSKSSAMKSLLILLTLMLLGGVCYADECKQRCDVFSSGYDFECESKCRIANALESIAESLNKE